MYRTKVGRYLQKVQIKSDILYERSLIENLVSTEPEITACPTLKLLQMVTRVCEYIMEVKGWYEKEKPELQRLLLGLQLCF